jgi:hypothetical protein
MSAEESTATNSVRRQRRVQSRKQPKRQRSSPGTSGQSTATILELHLKLPPALPSGLVNHVSASALWNHLLYARGLVPMPVYQILEKDEATTIDPFSRAIKRKLSQTKKSLEQLGRDWKMVDFLCPHMHNVLLSLGPSWSRIKESYVIHAAEFLCLDHLDTCQNQPSTGRTTAPPSPDHHTKNRLTLSRLLLRELMQLEAAHCDCNRLSASFQIFVSFWISTTTAAKLFESNDNSLLARLIVRQDFNPQGKHTYRQVNIHFDKIGNSSECRLDGGDGVWVSLRSSIKGFRL